MVIAPVNSVNFKNNYASLNFGSRKNNDTEGQEFNPSQRRNTTDLSKMPVVVLLAMTPALSEAKVPENYANIIPITTNYTKPEQDVSTYARFPETQETPQSKAPFGYQGLRNDAVKLLHDFKINGVNCHLILTSTGANKSTNIVDYAYIIYDNKKPDPRIMQSPPEITKLVYHNIGKDKEFCGVIIDEDIIGNDDKYKGTIRKEVRLDDNTAQILIDLITGYSKFKNESTIKLEEVKTPQMHPVKVYE